MWDGHDGMGWWMVWGGILWIILILAVVLAAARLIDGSGGGTDSRPPGPLPPAETPLDIVRRRYAAGEISREEYEQLRHDLS